MLYEVYFDDEKKSTMSGYFEEPGSVEEAQVCAAVLEQVFYCLERGIARYATFYRDGVLIQKFKSPTEVERIRALPRDDLDDLIAEMTSKGV